MAHRGIGQPITGMPDIPRDWRFSEFEDELTDIAAQELKLYGIRADKNPVSLLPEPPSKPTFSERLKEFLRKVRNGGLEHVTGK